jgi:hypothetical protein
MVKLRFLVISLLIFSLSLSTCKTATKKPVEIKNTDKIEIIGSLIDDEKYQKVCNFSLTEEQARFFLKNAVITSSHEISQHYIWSPCYVKGRLITRAGTYEWVIREVDFGYITTPDGKDYWLTCDGFDYYLGESGKEDEKTGYGLVIQDFKKFFFVLRNAIKKRDKKTVEGLLSRNFEHDLFEHDLDGGQENDTLQKIVDSFDYDLVEKILSFGYTEALPGKYAYCPVKEKSYLTEGYLIKFYNYGSGWKVIQITHKSMP